MPRVRQMTPKAHGRLIVIHKQQKWIQTPDEWHPCHRLPDRKGRFVQASFTPLSDGLWRVCCWGDDDFGMERDFESRMDAWLCFKALPNPVTIEGLRAMGFINA